MLIYDVILDVGSTGCQQNVSFYQGDDRFRLLRITLLQNGSVYAVASDLNVRLHGVKPDDSVFSKKCGTCGGSVVWLPAADVTDTAGLIRCQLQIRDRSDAILFTPEFSVEIDETLPVPDLPEGASEDTEYNAEVLSELTASADGSTLLFRGEPVVAIPSVSELPESAEEDEMFYWIGNGIFRRTNDTWHRLTDDATVAALCDLSAESHTHANKAALDTITAAKITGWDSAAENSHAHANKTALDAVTAAKVNGWNAAADDSHAHVNKSVLDEISAQKVSDWNAAAGSRHAHANKATLDAITAAKTASWDVAANSKHTHANKSALDAVTLATVNSSHTHANKTTLNAITAAKTARWDAAANDMHVHENASALDAVTVEKVTRWDAAEENSHSHVNRSSLDRIRVSESYAALATGSNPLSEVGFVTGKDVVLKPLSQYDAQTDADAPLTISRRLVYDPSAQIDGSVLEIETENDDVGIMLLPVYKQDEVQADPVFGGAGMFFVTDQNDPKRYVVICETEGVDASNIFEDFNIRIDENVGASALFFYAFENISGVLTGRDGAFGGTLCLWPGWNVCFLIEDGESIAVSCAQLPFPGDYCDFGVFEQFRQSAPQHPFLYDVLALETTADKRGIYRKDGSQWVRYYGADLDDLTDRLSVVEHGAPDDVTPLGFDAYSDLVVRDEAVTGESIMDVPVFVQGGQGIICSLYEYTSDPVGLDYDDGIEISDLRQYDTGMPLFVVSVTVGGVRYSYFPQDFNGGLAGMVYAGWNVNNQPSDPPTITNFTPDRFSFGGVVYDDLDDLPDAAKSALRSLSQCINVSADAMGTIHIPDDAVTRFAGTFEMNRKYNFITGSDCTFTLSSVPFAETDAQFVLYLTCTVDVDLTFSQGTRFAGGTAPNSDAGSHKLIGCWLRDAGAWALGGIVYEEVS